MRFYLICTFLLGTFILTFSNDTSRVADSLFEAESFFDAAVEYERLFYFSNDYRDKNRFRFKKALCFKSMGDYSASKNELVKINLIGLNPDEKRLITYETALISFVERDYEFCAKTLMRIEYDIYEQEQRKNLFLIATLNYAMMEDFENSEKFALKFASLNSKPDQLPIISNQIKQAYLKKNRPRIKSEKVFDWIGIIPGFGQFYVGKFGEGITNIALNVTAFSFGVFQIINGFYFTGYFVGTLSINKFYFGGRTRAKNLFKEVNAYQLTNYQNKLREILVAE